MTSIPTDRDQQCESLAERLFQSVLGTFDIFSVYIGNQMGFYAALAGGKAMTAAQLASSSGAQERYALEWLEQQAVSGILQLENAGDPGQQRRFRLPEGHAEVLLDGDSLNYLAPLSQLVVGAVSPIESVLQAYRRGGGVPYHEYGKDLLEGQAAINRPMFLHLMGTEWLPSIPDLDRRLKSDPPARVADIGCGAGWSCIGIAQSYPRALVDGFDLDEASVELARRNIEAAGFSDRARCHLRDAADPQLSHRYDLVTAFECIHDMSQPVAALKAMRSLLAQGGEVLIVDENVGEAFDAHAGDVERMMYGWSILHCLPVGMADQPSAATGTVMRPDTLRRYADEAGFQSVEILPIEHLFFRFYRLLP